MPSSVSNIGLTVGSLCSGIGGLELGLERAFGARTVWQSEIDKHAATVLAHHWSDVPNLGDLRAVDWSTVEPVDLVCMGVPCQNISDAGRREGLSGAKSSLWFDCADVVRVVQPRFVFIENVGALRRRGLERVLYDLAEMGYVGRWGSLRSAWVGAPHRRERIFVAAHSCRAGAGRDGGAALGPQEQVGRGEPGDTDASGARGAVAPDAKWGKYEPAIRRWEQIFGPAPAPIVERDEPWQRKHGRKGTALNPRFGEWMMGFPYGWTDMPGVPRTGQLHCVGNAVQPQVAELAALLLLGEWLA